MLTFFVLLTIWLYLWGGVIAYAMTIDEYIEDYGSLTATMRFKALGIALIWHIVIPYTLFQIIKEELRS